jgi:hypothetical protein
MPRGKNFGDGPQDLVAGGGNRHASIYVED